MRKIILLASTSILLSAQSGESVAKKAFAKVSGYGSSVAKTTMILKNAQGDKNIRKLEMKRLERSNGDKSFLVFLYPNDLKDTKLLSFEVIGSDDKQWLYLPALKRVKQITSRNKSGSFMASEFSYEDISSQNYKNYTYPSEAKVVMKNGMKCFKVLRVPKDPNSGYSKQIIYIDTKSYLARSGDYYDKNNRLLKKVSFKNYALIDGVYRVHKLEIKNVQNRKSSSIIWNSDKLHAGLSANDFSKRRLK